MKKRHYCRYCKRKRYETEMFVLRNGQSGRASWACESCSDMRKAFGGQRTQVLNSMNIK